MNRKIVFEKGVYYHIYNRGTDKRKIFNEKGDLHYFFDSIQISNTDATFSNRVGSKNARIINKGVAKNNKKLVSIISFCLLPNHFHLILRQEKKGGVSKFMQKLSTSYTKYFNAKYNRSGALFQGKFKASYLAFENSLERTSAYVNLNYKHHKINPKKELVKTSLFEFLGAEMGERICDSETIKLIVKESGGMEKYKRSLMEYEDEFLKEKKLLKGLES